MEDVSGKSRLDLIILFVCIILQLMISPNIAIMGVSPNFLLIAVICSAMLEGSRKACIIGFICGLIYDFTGVGAVGAMVATLVLVGYLAGAAAKSLMNDNWVTMLIVIVVSALCAEFIYAILLALMGENTSFFQSILYRVLPATLYETLVGCIAIPIIKRVTEPPAARIKGGNHLR